MIDDISKRFGSKGQPRIRYSWRSGYFTLILDRNKSLADERLEVREAHRLNIMIKANRAIAKIDRCTTEAAEQISNSTLAAANKLHEQTSEAVNTLFHRYQPL